MEIANAKRATPPDQPPADCLRASRPARVLIAEDDPELRWLLAAALRKDGYQVEEVTTGFDFLARAGRPNAKGPKLDLIISDIRMPGMTGLEVLSALRGPHHPEGWNTPVILMTAFGDQEIHAEAKRLEAAIFDKPFDLDELRRCATHLASPVQVEAQRSLVSLSAGRRAEVLLAEDDRELRHFLAQALRKDGYRVTEARSGDELLDRLWERANSNDSFDLIISDNRMPGFTGLAVLEGLRDECEPQIGVTPIILITAFGDQQIHEDAERLGAVVFDKPFDVDDLRAYAAKIVQPIDELDSLYCEYGGGD